MLKDTILGIHPIEQLSKKLQTKMKSLGLKRNVVDFLNADPPGVLVKGYYTYDGRDVEIIAVINSENLNDFKDEYVQNEIITQLKFSMKAEGVVPAN